MGDIEYDSLWELGNNCAAKRMSLLLTDGEVIDGPFSWGVSSSPLTSASILITPSYRQIEEKYISIISTLPLDMRTGYVYSHQGDFNDPAVREKAKERMGRRYKRIFSALNNPQEKPLLLWIGVGDRISTTWQQLNQSLFPYTEFSLPVAQATLSSLHNNFPADSRLLYFDFSPRVNKVTLCYMDDHLVAYAHPISGNRKQNQHTKWLVNYLWDEIGNTLPVKKSKAYSLDRFISSAPSGSFLHKVRESSGREINYLFNLNYMAAKIASFSSPDNYPFPILSYSTDKIVLKKEQNSVITLVKQGNIFVENA